MKPCIQYVDLLLDLYIEYHLAQNRGMVFVRGGCKKNQVAAFSEVKGRSQELYLTKYPPLLFVHTILFTLKFIAGPGCPEIYFSG